MTWYPIGFYPPQFEDTSGDPYSGAVLKAYAAETTTVIPMATGIDGVTTASSFPLNAAGYPISGGMVIIPHVQVNFKLALYPDQASADANSGAVWTYDDIQIAADENTAFVQTFSGDNTTTDFILTEDLGDIEETIMVFADRKFEEYTTNGTFASDTVWTKGAGWTIGAGVATASTASSDLSETAGIIILAGESYTITYTITRSAGTVTPSIGGVSGTTRNASGTYTETIIAGATQVISFTGAAFSGTVDNVSVHLTTAVRREILRPDEFTLDGTTISFNTAPAAGTNNILVFAPSRLLGQVAALAAAAAISEANALAYANIAKAAAGFAYTYDTDTTASDPGAGFLRFNNANLTLATALYISETTGLAQAIAAEIATWDDSTSLIHTKLRLFKQGDPSIFLIYNVTGTLTDNGAWDTLTVAYVTGSGVFADNDIVTIQALRTGDLGSIGPAGSSLPIAAATGTVNVITADYTPDIVVGDKVLLAFTSSGANTSTTPTFSPDGATARTIVKKGGVALVAGDIGALGSVHILEFNFANLRWELLNPCNVSGSTINNSVIGGTTPAAGSFTTINGDLITATRDYFFTVVLADDTATSFFPPATAAHFGFGRPNSLNSWAMGAYATGSGTMLSIHEGSNADINLTDGTLTGTTGVDGQGTMRASSTGFLYLENRSGLSNTFYVWIKG